MKSWVKCILVIFVVLFAMNATAADKAVFGTDPKTKDGKKWRIGYYEGGEYIDYQGTLVATVKGLMKLGWMKTAELPPLKGEETLALWEWLTTKAESPFIEFVADGHYTANWEENQRKETVKTIIDRLKTKKDIDLMIAMGTWAGKDLATDDHSTPTIVGTASDAVGADIIHSNEDSGFDHVSAHVDPERYKRQVQIFHDVIQFKRLGVIYEDSINGRSYAAIEKVEQVAKKRGFEIVRCLSVSDIPDVETRERNYLKCFEDLATKVDAIYISIHGGVSSRTIPELVKIANKNHIPTFSQAGSQEVHYGCLLSMSNSDFKYVGLYHAETIAKVFNGAKPRDLEQVFEGPPKVAINLITAERIGFDPPMVLLGAADEIFNEIKTPDE